MKCIIVLAAAIACVCGQQGYGSGLPNPPPASAVAKIVGDNISGEVHFTALPDGRTHVVGAIRGLAPGSYGFHVHEKGDLTGGCLSTGGHFNPEKHEHGHPDDENRHVGDLGNLVFSENGEALFDFTDRQIALSGPHNIIGRAVVLHSGTDDFGRSSHPDSKKTGNAGGRAACGVIGIAVENYVWSSKAVVSVPLSITSILLVSFISNLF